VAWGVTHPYSDVVHIHVLAMGGHEMAGARKGTSGTIRMLHRELSSPCQAGRRCTLDSVHKHEAFEYVRVQKLSVAMTSGVGR
jgi:hypothetical protein